MAWQPDAAASPSATRRAPPALAFWQSKGRPQHQDAVASPGRIGAGITAVPKPNPLPSPSSPSSSSSASSTSFMAPAPAPAPLREADSSSTLQASEDDQTSGGRALEDEQARRRRRKRLLQEMKRRRKNQVAASSGRGTASVEGGLGDSNDEDDDEDLALSAEIEDHLAGLQLHEDLMDTHSARSGPAHRHSRSLHSAAPIRNPTAEEHRHARGSTSMRGSLSQDAGNLRKPRSSESSDTQSFYDAADTTDESPDLVSTARFPDGFGIGAGTADTGDDRLDSWLHLRPRGPLVTASSSTLRQDNMRASLHSHPDAPDASAARDMIPAPAAASHHHLNHDDSFDPPADAHVCATSFLPSPPMPSSATLQQMVAPQAAPRKASLRLPPPRPQPAGPLPPTPSAPPTPTRSTAELSSPASPVAGASSISSATTPSQSSAGHSTDANAPSARSTESAAPQRPPVKPLDAATFPPMSSSQPSALQSGRSVGSARDSRISPAPPSTSAAAETIRGRPRGATIGAIPSIGSRVSNIISRPPQHASRAPRPRSLLSHELTFAFADGTPRGVSLPRSDPFLASSATPSDLASVRAAAPSSIGGASIHSRRTSLSACTGTGMDSSMTSYSAPTGQGDGEKRALRSDASHMAESGSIAASPPTSALEERRPAGSNTRSRSGSTASVLLQQVQHPKSHANFVIAVVGHLGAGKSTVIKKGLRQFGLSKPQVLSERVTSHSTVCIVDHEQRIIEVLEIDTSVLLNGPSKRFCWPKFLPPIDAVILCYDASNLSSFRSMSELLENFAIGNLSTVMLACKSELVPKVVDPYYASEMAGVYNVGLAECSAQSEEGRKRMRDCFSYLVKEVAKARATRGKARDRSTSTSEASSAGPRQDAAPSSSASSISSRLPSQGSTTASNQRERSNSAVSGFSGSSGRDVGIGSRPERPGPQRGGVAEVPLGVSAAGARNVSGSSTRTDPSSTLAESSVGDDGNDAAQDSIARAQLGLQSAKSVGGYVTLDKLWDKLFFAAVTGTEERFLLMFMVFYRGFVRPIELLRQLISRFESLAQREQKDSLIRYSLLRLTGMLGDWMEDYPGDLSGPEIHPIVSSFFERLSAHPTTSHLAVRLRPAFLRIKDSPDLDAAWSKDQDSSKPKSVAADVPPVRPPISPLTPPHMPTEMTRQNNGSRDRSHSDASSVAPQSTGSEPVELRSLGLDVEAHATRGRSASDLTTGSLPATMGDVSNSSSEVAAQPVVSTHQSEEPAPFEYWSPGGQPTTTKGLHIQKLRLRAASSALVEIDANIIAAELTRLEWDLFIAIKPRDLLRHILSSREARPKDGPVAKSIAFFNYVSYWVGSMIVVQGKTKLRAKMLEKFMTVAGILRHDNNYNTLQAVLAGLGNSAVHRLKTAHALNHGKPVIKSYQSLLRLMGSDRSFAAYRLALENSETRTIPYLGVHLQDILSMSDGNPSKRATDEMVHWRKFSLMDEAVMALVHCQQRPGDLSLPVNKDVERHIMGLPLFDEETLYTRSLSVEPRGSHGPASSLPGSRILSKYLHTTPA
ncbi:unnamed protein product [Parajaminaea phylloscopi]